MAEKRIINLTESAELTGSDYLVVDSATSGTRKISGSVINNAIGEVAEDVSSLDAQFQQFIAPTGEAPNPTEIENARVGADGVTYTNLGTAIRTQVSDLKADLNVVVDHLHTKNLLNPNTVTDGYYVNYTTGNPSALANMCYSDFIPVDGANYVTISRQYGLGIGGVHAYFYSKPNFDSKVSGALFGTSDITKPVPSGAKYLVISVATADKAGYMVEVGNTATDWVRYYSIDVPKDQKIIKFTYPNDGYFRDWLNVAGQLASKYHWVDFYIPNGSYNMRGFFSASELADATFKGVFVPDYVTIVGEEKEKTVLYVTLDSANSNLSTLNLAGSCGLKNLTVKGTNVRYAVHDDFATKAYTQYDEYYYRNVENCLFETITPVYGCYGSGTRGGAVWHFKECDFIGGFSWHSWSSSESSSVLNSSLPNDITLERCRNITDGTQGMVLKSLASGVENKIHLIGCDIPFITITEENSGIGIDFIIDGYGNNNMPIKSTADGIYYMFEDCVAYLKANSALVRGNSVLKNVHLCPKFNGNTNVYGFFGIALQDISANDWGFIQHKGYIDKSLISSLSSAVDGNLVGLASGLPTVVTDRSKAIGIIENQWTNQFLRLFAK